VSNVANREREQTWAVLAVFLIVLCLGFRLPVTSSFWIDETITRWVINDSFSEVWRRVVTHQGQSPFYYLLAWIVSRVIGFSEVALRSLSLVSVALTCLVLVNILRRFKQDILVIAAAIITILISDEVQRAALSARPYGLGMLCVAVSFHQLIRFADTKSTTAALGYLVSVLAVFYAHYLFIVVIGVQLIYAVLREVPLKHIIVTCVVLSIGMLPGFGQLASLNKVASQLSFAPEITASRLIQGVAPLSLLTVASIAVILGVIWSSSALGIVSKIGEGLRKREILLLFFFVLSPVILFAFISLLGSNNLFVARYWVWQQLGVAILVGLVSRVLTESRSRYVFLSVLVIGSVARIFSQDWVVEEWRGVAERVRDAKRVVLYSGLIEGEDRRLRDEIRNLQYLSSPLRSYGYKGEILLLGRDSTPEEIEAAMTSSDYLVAFKLQSKLELAPLTNKIKSLGSQQILDYVSANNSKVAIYQLLKDIEHRETNS